MKRISIVLASLMVLIAFAGSICAAAGTYVSYTHTIVVMERISSVCVTLSAALAVVLAWLAGKIENPIKVFGSAIGITAGILLCFMGVYGACKQMPGWVVDSMKSFLLILVMLMAIIWLVGNMIRRHLTERK